MSRDEQDEVDCDVALAYQVWQDAVAVQEEHTDTELGLSFHDTQGRIGWEEHQECILPIVESMAQEIMDSRNPAEAYLLVKSSLCQMALVCFILGRQHEGAIL